MYGSGCSGAIFASCRYSRIAAARRSKRARYAAEYLMLPKSAPPKSLNECTTRSICAGGRPASSIVSASTSYIHGWDCPLMTADCSAEMTCSCSPALCSLIISAWTAVGLGLFSRK